MQVGSQQQSKTIPFGNNDPNQYANYDHVFQTFDLNQQKTLSPHDRENGSETKPHKCNLLYAMPEILGVGYLVDQTTFGSVDSVRLQKRRKPREACDCRLSAPMYDINPCSDHERKE